MFLNKTYVYNLTDHNKTLTNGKKCFLLNKLDSSIWYIKAATPLRLERRGGALDAEDLSPFLLIAFYRVRHTVNCLHSRTQQPVLYQPLPLATKIGSGKLWGGRKSPVVPPDGVACGKHSDPIVPENERMVEVIDRCFIDPKRQTSPVLGSES